MSKTPSISNPNSILLRSRRHSAGFILGSLSIASVITAGIFWLMYQLVSVVQPTPRPVKPPTGLMFIDDFDEPVTPPPKRVKPTQPEFVDMPVPTALGSWKGGISLPGFSFTSPKSLRVLDPHLNDDIGIGEREYMTLAEFQPQYPARALYRGLEGTCVVVYTITKTGSVKDARVDENRCTHTLFHEPSIKAASKFKYSPRIVDGHTVEAREVAKLFRFSITK